MKRMGKTRALSTREQEKRPMARSMTARNIDMEKLKKLKELCPCLIGSKFEGASLFLRYPPRHSYSIRHIDAIAATMLKLAEENELWRENFAGGIPGIEEMLRKRLAAKKGDGDEKV